MNPFLNVVTATSFFSNKKVTKTLIVLESKSLMFSMAILLFMNITQLPPLLSLASSSPSFSLSKSHVLLLLKN